MFKERYGNMWDFWQEYEFLCILTNLGPLDHQGRNVMGRGSAWEAAQRFPNLPAFYGAEISSYRSHNRTIPAALPLVSARTENGVIETTGIIAFATKEDWRYKSNLSLIERASRELMTFITATGSSSVLLPRPGCGAGGLNWDVEVKPLLSGIFDERVTVVAFRT